MAFEKRGNNSYLYKKECRGKRVVSVYCGKGETAFLFQRLEQINKEKDLREKEEKRRLGEIDLEETLIKAEVQRIIKGDTLVHDPGKIYVIPSNGTQISQISARLYNFVVGKHDLKLEHKIWLTSNIVPLLKQGGSIYLAGLASRTGSEQLNHALSKRRADAILAFLRSQTTSNFKVVYQTYDGERAAAFAGIRDGIESDYWRAVVISAWVQPSPPPPPPPKQTVMVRRVVYARWLVSAKMLDRGATSGDAEGARLADGAGAYMQEKTGSAVTRQFKEFPESYKVQVILRDRDTTGSADYLIGGAEMVSSVVDYNWQKRKRSPILVDSFYKIGPEKGRPPPRCTV